MLKFRKALAAYERALVSGKEGEEVDKLTAEAIRICLRRLHVDLLKPRIVEVGLRFGRNVGCHLVLDITFPPFRMIAPLTKSINWSALQMAYVVAPLRHAPKPKWKLEEALAFLNGPDFIPAANDPAQREFAGPRHFKFPTPRPSEDEENNTIYGRPYRCAERWQERPVIILLHGRNDSISYRFGFPQVAHRCKRAGFNVVSLVLPCHFERRPQQLSG